MQKRSGNGLQRLVDAAGHSIRGLQAAWQNEAAFRQELLLFLILLPTAFWLGTNMTQRALLVFSVVLVLVVELVNSAVENVVDRIGTENHVLSGRAKDLGSAAVMLSLIAAALVWGLVAWERWMKY